MLARLVLLAAQLIVGWFATKPILDALPPFGDLEIFAYAVVVGVIVWIVGLVLAQILREVGTPSSATLLACVVVALVGAAIVHFHDSLPAAFRNATRALHDEIYPLIGAALAYAIKR
jgi:hypothetical protein